MPDLYTLPADEEHLDGGCTNANGTLVWTENRAYTWTVDAGWTILPSMPEHIIGGVAMDAGVLVGREDEHVGFWTYGTDDWAWWASGDDIGASGGFAPQADGWAFGIGDVFGDALTLLHITPQGPETVARLREAPIGIDPVVWLGPKTEGDRFVQAIDDEVLYTLDVPLHDLQISPPCTERWSDTELEVQGPELPMWSLERPVEFLGGDVLLHGDYASTRRLDLHTGTLFPTGVVPLGTCPALWEAYASGDTETVARLVDSIRALAVNTDGSPRFPPDSLHDVHAPEGFLQSAVTSDGVLSQSDVPSPLSLSDRVALLNDTDAPLWDVLYPQNYGAWGNDLIAWDVWLERPRADTVTCRETCDTMLSSLLPEALVARHGPEACRVFFEALRGPSPPTGPFDALDYREDRLRPLVEPYGPAVASVVTDALTDDSAAVRVAACLMAGASDEEDIASSIVPSDNEATPTSVLWPDRETIPRDAIVANLSHETHGVQAAAAKACRDLRLRDAAPSLQPLLHGTPMLHKGCTRARGAALRALVVCTDVPGEIGADVETLATTDPDDDLRRDAVEALDPLWQGPQTARAAIEALGDMDPFVAREASDVLESHGRHVSPELFRTMADRWLLQMIVVHQSSVFRRDMPRFPAYVFMSKMMGPEGLEQIRSLVHDPFLTDSERDAFRESADLSDDVLAVAPAGMLLPGLWATLVENEDVFDDSSPQGAQDVLDDLLADTYLDELDESLITDAPSRTLGGARFALRVREHDPWLGTRLAAMATYVLGPPSEPVSSSSTSDYEPLHQRLRAASSGRTPDSRCYELTQALAEESGTAGLIGNYILALHDDKTAEARMIETFAAGAAPPVAWTLLYDCSPFDQRPDSFHHEVLGAYLASSTLPLFRRLEAFDDLFFGFSMIDDEDTRHISLEQWEIFLRECAGARALLDWNRRHTAAQHVYRWHDDPGPLQSLWAERGDSVDAIDSADRRAFARDHLWTDADLDGDTRDTLWETFWNHETTRLSTWDLRMLADRGRPADADRIKRALADDNVASEPAQDAIRSIRTRHDG
jgi:hypothetical protein